MAYEKKIVADSVVTRLIESQGIYNTMNRAFDGLVRPGASSVDVPLLAIPNVKTSGTAVDHADRTFAHNETTMVNVPMVPYAVPLADELLSQFETNGNLISKYLDSASMALQQKFDSLVITAAQGTSDKTSFAGASMAWADVVAINKKLDLNKCPKNDRVLIIDANIADEFFSLDVVKAALGYNPAYLEKGFVTLMNMKVFVSGLVPTITVSSAEKYTMIGAYGPGVAFILNRVGELREAWDTVNLQTIVDMVAHAGVKLLANAFATVKYKP